jgi:PAS domain S-box-containing protein
MLNKLKQFLLATLRRQLITGMVLAVTLMMSLFIWEMSTRQHTAALEQQSSQAIALTRGVATSSAVWVASRDFSGLQEIVQGVAHYPDLRHAIVLDPNGQILAHNTPTLRGQYLHDLPLQAELKIVQQTSSLVDVISPVILSSKQVGWVRIGLGNDSLNTKLAKITRDGIFYIVIAIALSIALATLAARYLTRRLDAIQQIADKVQLGKTDLRVRISGTDEAAKLARQFNAMLDNLAQREQELKASESQFRTLVQNIPEVVYRCALDEHWTILFISDHIESVSGYPTADFVGNKVRSFASIIYPDDLDKVDQVVRSAVASKTPYNIEYRIVHRNGEVHWVIEKGQASFDNQGQVMWLDGVLRDISERKQAELDAQKLRGQLAQATKMEAVGHLTAGIAHDFNNMLGAIMGYTELSKLMLASNKPLTVDGYLDEILKASNRAKELIAQMLTFSRLQVDMDNTPAPSTLLTPVVKEVVSLLRSSIPSTIELNYEVKTEDLKACINPVQMHQIILNLCVNARDSIGEYGKINVTLSREQLDDAHCASCQHPFSGEFAKISVSDTGSGIDTSILNNIFNPFFTTKGVGKGTGMGLSVVHGLVHAMHGHIQIESIIGKGTVISVLLPLSLSNAVTEKEGTHQQSDNSTLQGVRIMVVDDEQAMTAMLQEFLSMEGADVTVINSPVEAMRVFEHDPNAFDIVITDETMPGLSGMHMAELMLRFKPQLPIILSTGYSEHATAELAEQAGLAGFFNKPIKINELLRKLKTIKVQRSWDFK